MPAQWVMTAPAASVSGKVAQTRLGGCRWAWCGIQRGLRRVRGPGAASCRGRGPGAFCAGASPPRLPPERLPGPSVGWLATRLLLAVFPASPTGAGLQPPLPPPGPSRSAPTVGAGRARVAASPAPLPVPHSAPHQAGLLSMASRTLKHRPFSICGKTHLASPSASLGFSLVSVQRGRTWGCSGGEDGGGGGGGGGGDGGDGGDGPVCSSLCAHWSQH